MYLGVGVGNERVGVGNERVLVYLGVWSESVSVYGSGSGE